jgi:hypothetical protein
MSGQHDGLPVAGYRSQPRANIDLVNDNKHQEENTLRMLDALAANPDVDKRWLAIGRTHLELAFMAINRSIFKPDRAILPGDDTDLSAPQA